MTFLHIFCIFFTSIAHTFSQDSNFESILSKFKPCTLNVLTTNFETSYLFHVFKRHSKFPLILSKTNKRQSIIQHTKFIQCISIFLFFPVTPKNREIFQSLGKCYNANSIWFITPIIPENSVLEYAFFADFTSTYFLVTTKDSKVYMVCTFCQKSLFLILHENQLSNSYWKSIHLKYRKKLFVANIFNMIWEDDKMITSCALKTMKFTTDFFPSAAFCFLLTVKNKLNFTGELIVKKHIIFW